MTSLEQVWDSYMSHTNKINDPRLKMCFYAGAMAVLFLIDENGQRESLPLAQWKQECTEYIEKAGVL